MNLAQLTVQSHSVRSIFLHHRAIRLKLSRACPVHIRIGIDRIQYPSLAYVMP